MKLSRSRLALALAAALMLGTTMLSPPALAEWKLDAVYYAPNSTTAVFKDGNRECHVTYIRASDPYIVVYYDTGPDDAGTDRHVEKPDVISMLKHSKAGYTITLAPESTPLSKWIESGGFGFNPHGNPGDTDTAYTGHGQPPKRNDGSLTQRQIASIDKLYNMAVQFQQLIGIAMGGGEEGGSESWQGLDKSNNNSNRNNSGKNNDDGKNKFLGRSFDSLGPRPDLVNPPHSKLRPAVKAATANVTTRTISNIGTSSAGSARSSVIGAGLLDGGGAFSAQGPSATGARIGTGSGGLGAHGASGAGIH